PVLSVVTNIDTDHMETYGHDFARLKKAFVEFLQRLPFYGAMVACVDDAHVREILPQVGRPMVSYGFSEDAMLQARQMENRRGTMHFVATQRGFADLPVVLALPGRHSVQNALAAIAVGREVGVAEEAIVRALAGFKGVGRRFQRYGEIPLSNGGASGGGSYTLIDDYGHHPNEIAATLAAVRGSFDGRRLVLVFQPHRYTRTRDLFEDFVAVLSQVDVLVLVDVYPAGETPIVAADGRALARALRVAGKVDPVFVERVDEVPQVLASLLKDGDVVLTMGAGNIGTVASRLQQKAEQKTGKENTR
ncbi:MAG: UDP-N-acetylmuramate--L-alanine ligase, partial [Burkholderiales bacterium]|nr:UDP-N-acetylmuramate--L-alanine ligase [Burkholderiales bacterium]